MPRMIGPLLVAVIFVIYQSWPLFTEAQQYNDDQNNIYLLATRRADPTFLAQDYAYGNADFLRFYTPFYLDTLRYLSVRLGSYDVAMLVLHSLMLSIYLVTMFVLLRYVCGNSWIAIIVALFSALARPAIASEVWGAAGMRLVFPRTAFLAVAPLLFWLLLRWLPIANWRRIGLLGLLGGMSANLHPPSGLFFVQILVTLVVVFEVASDKKPGRSTVSTGKKEERGDTSQPPRSAVLPLLEPGISPASAVNDEKRGGWGGGSWSTELYLREAIWKVALIGLMALIGALPTFAPLFQNITRSGQKEEAPSFESVASIIHERSISIFPFPPDQLMLPNGPLSETMQERLVMIGLGLVTVWLGLALWHLQTGRVSRRFLIAAILLISLPFAYLATILAALDLIMVALAYWLVRLVQQSEDRVDLYALGIFACAALYSFAGSAVLAWIWRTFELWSLTSFYSEQARMSRFIYLPLYIFMARWLLLLLYRSRYRVVGTLTAAGLVAGLVVRHWHFRDPWGSAEWGMGGSLLILGLIGVWSCLGRRWPAWNIAVVAGLAIATTIYLWFYILGFSAPGLFAAGIGLAGGALYYVQWLSIKQWRWAAGLLVLLSLGWLFVHGKAALYNEGPLRVQAYKALGLYQYEPPDQKDLDALAMRRWIKANTPPESVFYFNDRQLEFRSQTHRAVTHSWKDLSAGYYTPPLLVEYYDRFKQLESAYEAPASLVACAQAYQANYIIIRSNQPELSLPLAYSNDSYKVYAVEKAAAGQAACL